MKKIEAFVRPERLDDIRKVLVETGHRKMSRNPAAAVRRGGTNTRAASTRSTGVPV